MKRVVILGATSEIAQAVARRLAASGLELLLVGRSAERLDLLGADLLARGAARVITYAADLAATSTHAAVLQYAAANFAAFDTVLLAYGSMLDQQECQSSPELAVREITTNFTSAAALLTVFAEHLRARRTGTLAVITSVAGDRGRRPNYVYGSAKAGLSVFLQGLRSRLHPAGVRVLTIKPGLVDTPMTAAMKKNALFASPDRVAADIVAALKNSRVEVLYTPWYWKWIMRAVRAIPESRFKKLSF